MATVGIIANPASGKDIRRIVSGARVVSHQEKANIISRFMAGLNAEGDHEILLMPDGSGLSRKIEDAGKDWRFPPKLIELNGVSGTWKDTLASVEHMVQNDVSVIVTLGGDGTNRIVSKACGKVPLIPISTGTNNVFPQMIEGTLAGLAAGRVASLGEAAHSVCKRAPMFEIVNGQGVVVDNALIDIAVVRSGIRGALAVWQVEDIYSALVTRARSDVIGLSAIAGAVAPNGQATRVMLGKGGRKVRAAIAPALVPELPIEDVQEIVEGAAVPLGPPGAMLAFDGEREMRVEAGKHLFARLTRQGPWVVDIAAALSGTSSADENKNLPTEEFCHGTK